MNERVEKGRDIADQARDWLIRLSESGNRSANERALESWRKADTRHEEAYRRAEGLWLDLAERSEFADIEALDDLLLRERAVIAADATVTYVRRLFAAPARRPIAAFALAAVLVIGLGLIMQTGSLLPNDTITTQVAEIRDVKLADGSIVTLGARSEISVNFSEAERSVTLNSGEAYFSVTKDASRPFVVTAGETIVRVLGTKFDVRRGGDRTRVAVAEGIVEVMAHASSSLTDLPGALVQTKVLTAGQQLVSGPRNKLEPMRTISQSAPGAWRTGRLEYVDASLADVLADASRYFDGRIEFDPAEMAELRLTASFRTDQIDEMINTVAAALPVTVDRSLRGRVVLKAIVE